jgi:hypothetical protein
VFLLAFFLIFTSCDDSAKNNEARTYVAGEIVNPTSNFLIFKNDGKVLDTVYLDAQNRFSYEIDSAQQGLYIIEHRPETQNFYLTPGDSLLLRVNTLAFDESLHFSGSGDAENNFLAEMYLMDESNADLLLSFYDTDPSDFKRKTDSIRSQRLSDLNRKKKKYNFSKEFIQLAEKVIQYESYDLQERYIYLFNKYRKGSAEKLPADFDDYRKEVKFNEKMLQSSPGYKRFIDNYLINQSFKWCAKQAFDYNDCYSITDTENIKSRIRMVDHLIQIPSLRKHFFTKLASLGIIMAKSREEILEIIDLAEKVGFSENGIKDLKQLGSVQLAYLPGTTITGVPLIDAEGNTRVIEDIINKPTIVFLWTIYSNQHQENHERIAELRKKYPEIDFIGINLDVGEVPSWRIAVQKYNYAKDFEYQLGPTRIEKRFFKFFFNKLLFLDPSGQVIIGDTFINSPNLENRILEFLNR